MSGSKTGLSKFFLGRFFASTCAKLREISERLRVRHLIKLTGCPIR